MCKNTVRKNPEMKEALGNIEERNYEKLKDAITQCVLLYRQEGLNVIKTMAVL